MHFNREDTIDINHATENYRIAGIIFSLVGGVGIILSGCEIYKEIS